jgi:plasmid stabilization system protein ParE
VKLVWMLSAMEDRERHFSFIAEDSFANAVLVDDRVELQCELLKKFPELGGLDGSVAPGSWWCKIRHSLLSTKLRTA